MHTRAIFLKRHATTIVLKLFERKSVDSINQNHTEENRADLDGSPAITKIKELVEKAQSCFFCTTVSTAQSATRPTTVQEVDDAGNLWFLSASDSHKNLELASDPPVKLYFQGSPHSGFLQLDGHATLSTDKAKIKALWKPILKTWFTDGEDDSRITVIKVVPSKGYYWDNKHGDAAAGVKMMLGAALCKTLDHSIEGTVRI